MKYLKYIVCLSMIVWFGCFAFLLRVYANSSSQEGARYSLQTSASPILPNSRIANYSIGKNGNIAVAFRSKEIMIYNSNGDFLKHIIINDSEHFFIDYRADSENIDVFFARNDTAILISEDGDIIEQYRYSESEIKDRRSASNAYTKSTELFTYKMKSSFRFPITTCSTKLVQINNLTRKEKVILDNPLMSIIESIGLVCIILVFGSIILIVIFKIIKSCVKYVVSILKS